MINEIPRQHLERIASHFESIAKPCKEIFDEWEPEDLVGTAYDHIGRMIVKEFHKIDDSTKRKIFDEIEAALQYDDEELDYALTTGLLEGLNDEALHMGNWPEVRSHFGPNTAEFVDSW